MPRAFGAAALAAILAAACGQTPRPVPISGSPADLSALEGEWVGEYHALGESGRSGTILFRLEAGADTATGDVLMHIAGRETAEILPFTGDPWSNVPEDRILTVSFVRAAGGTVYGRLDPYNDPVCGCEMKTTFTGRVKGNLIEGSYTSEHLNGGDRSEGLWRVVRRLRN